MGHHEVAMKGRQSQRKTDESFHGLLWGGHEGESARSEFTLKIHGKEGERNRREFTSWPTMRWPWRGDSRIEENSLHGLQWGGHNGETARSEFTLKIYGKGGERNRVEFTSWPTMRWPWRGDCKKWIHLKKSWHKKKKGLDESSLHCLPCGDHEGETARREFTLWLPWIVQEV